MNREKLSDLSSLRFIKFSCALLIVLMITGVLLSPSQYSYYENRNLSAFPEITLERVMDGSFFTDFDTYIKERSLVRNVFLGLSTFIDLHILHRPVVNDVVITKDTLLPFNDYEIVSEYNVNYYADLISENLKSHTELVESYNGSFYYVAVPCQYVCKSEYYPWYLNNRNEYTQLSRETLFTKLDESSVDYIDMLEYYENAGRPDSYTSNIDNHYSILGGYATYLEIINRINADGKYNLDPLMEDEFTYSLVETRYLGSRTRKIFDMWNISEPLGMITPNVEVPFVRYDYGVKVAPNVYSIPGRNERHSTYGVYMGGDIGETIIKTNRPELPSVLIYGDSFTNAVESLLWYNFDTMYCLDYRHYNEMDLHSYIEKYKPDIVICIRDYEAILAPWGNGL